MNIKNYIEDNNFRINITNEYIYIYSYNKIINISDTCIEILSNNKNIKIYGKDLLINKLDKKEMLIKGILKKVEL